MNGKVNDVTAETNETPDLYTTAGKLADLKIRYHEAVTASGEKAIEKQHAKGKKTARERIELLLDHGSFVELDEFVRHRTHAFGMEKSRPYGDAVVTGTGTIHGRQVCVYAQDFTIFGGSLGEVAGEKIIKVMDLALKTGVPIIGMLDSGGARIQEGVVALGKYGEIFRRNTMASGVNDLPQLHAEETQKHGAIETWANEWVGSDMAQLAANSPTRRAASIKVPVLLAAGREDETAPVEHTEAMERALKAAGVQVETSYYSGEGHGYYKPENRKDFYTKLLAFLARSLGGEAAAPAATTAE